MNSILTGKQFNEKYQGKTFVKLFTNDFLPSGLNRDYLTFNLNGNYQSGGISFIPLDLLSRSLCSGDQPMYSICSVNIPDYAQIYERIRGEKFWADVLILGKKENISDSNIWENSDWCLAALKTNGYLLQYVKNQTQELCLAAVKQNAWALQFVKNQTESICLEAVKQSGWALQFVKDQTPAICLAAVEQNGNALKEIRDQSVEICLAAVKQCYLSYEYVNERFKNYISPTLLDNLKANFNIENMGFSG